MKVTRINRNLLKRIMNSLPLTQHGSSLKSFEISHEENLIHLKTEAEDLLVYEYETLKEYQEEH